MRAWTTKEYLNSGSQPLILLLFGYPAGPGVSLGLDQWMPWGRTLRRLAGRPVLHETGRFPQSARPHGKRHATPREPRHERSRLVEMAVASNGEALRQLRSGHSVPSALRRQRS